MGSDISTLGHPQPQKGGGERTPIVTGTFVTPAEDCMPRPCLQTPSQQIWSRCSQVHLHVAARCQSKQRSGTMSFAVSLIPLCHMQELGQTELEKDMLLPPLKHGESSWQAQETWILCEVLNRIPIESLMSNLKAAALRPILIATHRREQGFGCMPRALHQT